jgi:chorismate dehydratase
MKNTENIINLGQISFTNCLPINYSFEKWHLDKLLSNTDKNIKMSSGYPTFVNSLFFGGKLHVAPVSSIEYLKNRDKCSIIDKICISSNGKVGSVMLFSQFATEELEGKKIGIPYTSASSTALLKIILKEKDLNLSKCNFINHKYEFLTDNSFPVSFDAVLCIGDPALIMSSFLKSVPYLYDLGEEWKILTGLPMVFGTWVARSDWKNTCKSDFDRLAFLLDKAVDDGLSVYFNEVVQSASLKLNLEESIIKDYLTNKIVYKFTSKHSESLDLFYEKYKTADF